MNAVMRRPCLAALAVGTIVPTVLLATAISMQHLLNLVPCHMCLEQRTALMVGSMLAAIGLTLHRNGAGRFMAIASASSIGASGWVAFQQLGGERRWWVLNMPCTSAMPKDGSPLENIMNTPAVRCDVPQWSYAGLTMADLNAAACVATVLVMLAMIVKGERKRRSETRDLQLQNSEEK